MAKAAIAIEMSETEKRFTALYGPTMDAGEVAAVLAMTVESIYTLRSIGRFPIPMFRGARRKLIAYTRDVADHLDRQRIMQIREDAELLEHMRFD